MRWMDASLPPSDRNEPLVHVANIRKILLSLLYYDYSEIDKIIALGTGKTVITKGPMAQARRDGYKQAIKLAIKILT